MHATHWFFINGKTCKSWIQMQIVVPVPVKAKPNKQPKIVQQKIATKHEEITYTTNPCKIPLTSKWEKTHKTTCSTKISNFFKIKILLLLLLLFFGGGDQEVKICHKKHPLLTTMCVLIFSMLNIYYGCGCH
jgi:hypothetical protein